MTPERFRQVEELYHAARAGTAEERAALLARADPELRREVELLLAQPPSDGLSDGFDGPAIANTPHPVEDSTHTSASMTPGVCLGPYRIERKLGEGGIGEVFCATDTRLAYLEAGRDQEAGRGQEAAAEFQKVLHNRGVVLADPIGALAYLQLGRALVLSGEKDRARNAYQEFLSLWKDADPDIPVLHEARVEYDAL